MPRPFISPFRAAAAALLTSVVPTAAVAAEEAGRALDPLLLAPWLLVAAAAAFAGLHARALMRRLTVERETHGQELDAARRELLVAFGGAAHGFALVAPNGRWLEVNEALCELLGFRAEELLEADFQSLTHSEDLARDIDALKQLRTGELPRHFVEKRFLRKSGGEIWTEMTLLPLRDDTGRVLRFVCHVHDLSARKAIEAELAKSQAPVGPSASAARRFAHEMGNLLTAVLGNIELAEDRAETDERTKKLLSTARRAAEGAAELTQKFHASARRASSAGAPD